MERLVIKSKAGSYYLNDAARGVMFEPYETEPHQRRLLLKRLYEYEDAGLIPDQIRELAERDTAKAPEENTPDPRAAERFRRKPYAGVKVLIRRQGEQIGDAAEYIARKYNIRGDADDRRTDEEDT